MRRENIFISGVFAALFLIALIPIGRGQGPGGGGGVGPVGGGGVSFPLLAPTGTVSAPSYAFSGAAGSGIYNNTNCSGPVITAGGSDELCIGNTSAGVLLPNTQNLSWNSTFNFSGANSPDVGLRRDAVGVLEINSAPGAGLCNNTPSTCRDLLLRHIGSGGTAPTANSCAGFALATGSSDAGGTVTFTSATSCAINFGTSFTNPPNCTVAPGSAASTVLVTRTAAVLTATFGTAQTAMSWTCVGL